MNEGQFDHNLVKCQTCPVRQFPCAGPCVCTVDGADIVAHAEADYCPHPDGPKFGKGLLPPGWKSTGAGDTVGKLASAIGLKPCGGCRKIRKALNAVMPYRDGK